VRQIWVSLVATGVALLSVAPVALTTGVAIDLARITVNETLQPGARYHLPAFGVRNPSIETTSYVNTVSYVENQGELRPPQTWFSFDPPRLTLDGRSSRAVSTTLVVPVDAEPGDYSALIGPTIDQTEAGASVGATAAAHLTFTVAPSSSVDALARWLWTFLGDQPWILLVLLLVVIAAMWVYVRRHFRFAITRRVDR